MRSTNNICMKLLQLQMVLLFTWHVTAGYSCTSSVCESSNSSYSCYKKEGVWTCGIASRDSADKSKKDEALDKNEKKVSVSKTEVLAAESSSHVTPRHTPSVLDIICLWEPHFSCPS